MANYGAHTSEELEKIGIYTITAPSGKKYVGVTGTSFRERWGNHIKELRGNRHKCRGLQRAYRKYGEEALVFSIEVNYSFKQLISEESFEQELLLLEQRTWDELSEAGIILYNGRPTGTGSVFHTEESKAALLLQIREQQLVLYDDLIKNEEMLLNLFSNKDLTWKDTAAGLNTTPRRLKRYLKFREEYFGLDQPSIPRRDSRSAAALSAQYMKDHNLTREQFNDAVKEHWKASHSKTATAEHFGITIKEVSFICNKSGRSPGLQRTHIKFHENMGRGYSDCLYCLDSGVEINVVVPTAEELRQLYVEESKTLITIALEYDITKAKVQQLLYTYDVRRA